jgi:hypothetical protein
MSCCIRPGKDNLSVSSGFPYIGIGSNLADRHENCREAIKQPGLRGVKVVKESSMIETEPWGMKDQPRFINMAVEAETVLSPEQLLMLLKGIEKEIGMEVSRQHLVAVARLWGTGGTKPTRSIVSLTRSRSVS